jgi:hypothetical protein
MRRFMISLYVFTLMIGTAARAAAQDAKPPLITNQAYVEDLAHKTSLTVSDPMAVFAYVLDSLPERVTVYPTENHYYFAFDLNGVRYAGNIKLVPQLRAEGKVAFAYYEDRATWLPDAAGTDLVVGSAQGVKVEKVEPLAYRITYKAKSVVFALNDLSNVKPPAAALGPDERFIGPIFDESAVRFFLVFNAKLKLFHFILDETIEPADVFVPAPVGEGRILIGKRTGFAVYRDQRRDRKIMIGVYQGNVAANNYLDGPFDQMPDNFIVGESFREAILAAAPDLKGQIDRYGGFADGSRFVLEPYMEYRSPKELAVFDRCATSRRIPAEDYEACFSLPLDEDHGAGALPLAMLRNAR